MLQETLSFTEACDAISKPAIIGWESEQNPGIRDTLLHLKADVEDVRSISIMIGSEGGLDDGEVEYAMSRGITPVSLGRRILRAETAGVIAAAVVLYEMGEMGKNAD